MLKPKTNFPATVADNLEALRNALPSGFLKAVRAAGLDPSVDFRFANLNHQDFSDQDLSGFDFTGADLRGSNFSNAKVSNAVFTDAKMDTDALSQADHSSNSETKEQSEVEPHNLSAEAAVLGAILYDNEAYDTVAHILQPKDFYAYEHREIFLAVKMLLENGRVADGVTLRETFERDKNLAAIGGGQYLADLLDAAAFGPEVRDYSEVIQDLSRKRELLNIASEIQSRIRNGAGPLDSLQQINLLEKEIFALAERGATERGFSSFSDALTESLRMADAAIKGGDKLSGLATLFDDLDYKLGGFHPSELIVLAGRPSMGKTTFALNAAFNIALSYRAEIKESGQSKTIEGGKVAFFSTEMSSEQLATRILADRASINSHHIRRGNLDQRDFENLRNVTEELQNLPLFIDDTPGLSAIQLLARARRLKRAQGLDVVFIDNLQNLRPDDSLGSSNSADGGQNDIAVLKAMSRELDVPVIILSDLSPSIDERQNKRPQLADLRIVSGLETYADVILFMYRESYYLEQQEPIARPYDPAIEADQWAAWRQRMDEAYGLAEIIVGKQRHGPIGSVMLAFEPYIPRFANLKRDDSSQ